MAEGRNYLQKVSASESGGKERAVNPMGGASGKYQFVKSTWEGLGYDWKDRFNPQLQEEAMKKYTDQTTSAFKRAFKTEPTDADLYGMHFLGSGTYIKALRAGDDTPITDIVSKQAYAYNKGVMQKNGRPITVGELRGWTSKKMGSGTTSAPTTSATPQTEEEKRAFIAPTDFSTPEYQGTTFGKQEDEAEEGETEKEGTVAAKELMEDTFMEDIKKMFPAQMAQPQQQDFSQQEETPQIDLAPIEYQPIQATQTEYQRGGQIPVSPNGVYDYPKQEVIVPTQDGRITMDKVGYPILGTDELGNSKMMYPNQEYQFPGKTVHEVPQLRDGGGLPQFQKAGQYQVGTMPSWNPQAAPQAAPTLPTERWLPGSITQPVPGETSELEQVLAEHPYLPEGYSVMKDDTLYDPSGMLEEVIIKAERKKPQVVTTQVGQLPEWKPVDIENVTDKKEAVKIQEQLLSMGYDIGSKSDKPDGIIGKKTKAAWAEFQATGKPPENISLEAEERLRRKAKPEELSMVEKAADYITGNLEEYITNPAKALASAVLPENLQFNPELTTTGIYDQTKGAKQYLLDTKSLEDIRKEENISFGQISKRKLKGNAILPLAVKNKMVNATNPQGYAPDYELDDNFITRLMDERSDTEQVKRMEGVRGDNREDIYRMYAGLPQKYDTFTASSFKAGKDSDTNVTFKKPEDVADYVKIAAGKTDLFKKLASGEITPESIARDKASGKKGGDKINKASFRDPKNVMWNATFGVDFDKAGNPYLSFYDNWDLALKDDLKATRQLFGAPIEIYDRIPLTKELIAQMAKIESIADSKEASDALSGSDLTDDKTMEKVGEMIKKDPKFQKEYNRMLESIKSRYK